MSNAEINPVVDGYEAGRTLADLATEFRVDRRTVAGHLQTRGVARRANTRKLNDRDVTRAATLYGGGESLAQVASVFDVDASTVRRALLRAGMPIRRRRGWQ